MGILDAPGLTVAQADARYPAAGRTLGVPETPFTVTRLGVSCLASATSAPSIFWPQIVRVGPFVPGAVDEYYRIRSTDHHETVGGIYFDSAPTITGPWTDRGLMYRDTSSGSQTEPGRLLYAPTLDPLKPWHLYYGQVGAATSVNAQTTCLAKSADLVTWTRVGIVLDIASTTAQPGDGHSGYFNPALIGSRIIGPSLRGGTTFSHQVMNESFDGVTFLRDWNTLNPRADWLPVTSNRRFQYINSNIIEWKGQLITIGRLATIRTITPQTSRIAWAPISRDLRTLLAVPQIIFEPTELYEEADVISCHAITEAGRIILTAHYDKSKGGGAGDGSVGTPDAVFATYELKGL